MFLGLDFEIGHQLTTSYLFDSEIIFVSILEHTVHEQTYLDDPFHNFSVEVTSQEKCVGQVLTDLETCQLSILVEMRF